jgi:predicted HD phosphohydrolase
VGLMAAALLHDVGEIEPDNTGAGLLGEAITRLDATLRVIEEVGRGPIADLAHEQTQPHTAIGPDMS